jgi:uncharacterized repeat protein (TIGR02543 family)
MSNQTANVPTALTLNAFTRVGYTFSGWNTVALGGGTSYVNGATYSFSADITLYAQWTISSTNRPPVADAGGPYFGNEGSRISLSASKSTDPDNNIVLYQWDLDNDGQFDDATGVNPKFAAIDTGVFIVRVKVTDAGGLSSMDDATVTVRNVPPVITSLSVSSHINVGVKVNAFATFKHPDAHDTFTAVWEWGDGTSSTGTVNGHTVTGSHKYTKPGTYLVTITIMDKDGGVGHYHRTIVVRSRCDDHDRH